MTMAQQAPPSALAFIIGTSIIAGLSGYFIGLASSVGVVPIPSFLRNSALFSSVPQKEKTLHDRYADEEESSEEEVSESDLAGTLDHAPNWDNSEEQDKHDGLRASTKEKSKSKKDKKKAAQEMKESAIFVKNTTEECKLVLVVRTDLGMGKGKIAAQCSHATLACYKTLERAARSSSGSAASAAAAQILRRWERLGQAKIALQVSSEEDMMTLQAKALSLGLVAEVIQDAGRTQIASGSRTVLGVGPAPKSVIDEVTGSLKLL